MNILRAPINKMVKLHESVYTAVLSGVLAEGMGAKPQLPPPPLKF